MSWDALKAVKDHQFGSASVKAVMMVLASYTDAEWWAFAGQKLIAEEAELSVRTVYEAMKDLESRGLIVRQRRYRHGKRTSDWVGLVEDAIMRLPEKAAGKSEPAGAELTGNRERPQTQPAQTLPATGADLSGSSFHRSIEEAIEEPPEEEEEPPTFVGATIEPVEAVETLPARRRDDVFEAVAEVCFGADWQNALTPTARGPLNRAVKELKAVGASPDDVAARAEAYVRWLGQRPTPMALVKHWPRLGDPIQLLPRRELEALAEEQLLAARMAEAAARERERLAEAVEVASATSDRQLSDGTVDVGLLSVRYPRAEGESVRDYVRRLAAVKEEEE